MEKARSRGMRREIKAPTLGGCLSPPPCLSPRAGWSQFLERFNRKQAIIPLVGKRVKRSIYFCPWFRHCGEITHLQEPLRMAGRGGSSACVRPAVRVSAPPAARPEPSQGTPTSSSTHEPQGSACVAPQVPSTDPSSPPRASHPPGPCVPTDALTSVPQHLPTSSSIP